MFAQIFVLVALSLILLVLLVIAFLLALPSDAKLTQEHKNVVYYYLDDNGNLVKEKPFENTKQAVQKQEPVQYTEIKSFEDLKKLKRN